MKKFASDYRLMGDRMVEVPWIREKMRDVKNSKIADFGGLVRNANGTKVAWTSFGIHESNKVTVYDTDPSAGVGHVRLNILVGPSGETHDIGLCVSAMEHYGLGKYGNERMDNGDLVGLRHMCDSIIPGGKLYVTVPFGRGIVLNEWIREYSSGDLGAIARASTGYISQADFFFRDPGDREWYMANQNVVEKSQHRKPKEDTEITGLVCMEIQL